MPLPKSKTLAQLDSWVSRTQAESVIAAAPPSTVAGSSRYWCEPRTFSMARPNRPGTLSTAGSRRSVARTSVSAPSTSAIFAA